MGHTYPVNSDNVSCMNNASAECFQIPSCKEGSGDSTEKGKPLPSATRQGEKVEEGCRDESQVQGRGDEGRTSQLQVREVLQT